MKISKSLERYIARYPDFLEDPESYWGQNWKTALNYWAFLDTLSVEQKRKVHERYIKINSYHTFSWSSYHQASGKEQSTCISLYSGGCISLAMPFYEIIAMHLLLEEDYQLKYVKMFENL